jgi:chromosome segregation ATPase
VTNQPWQNIDVLAAFVEKFKELEAAVADQQGLISQSKDAAKQAYTQVQTLQERCLNQQTEMKELREELAGTKTDCASQCQKLTFELGQEQWKLQLAQRSHDQTQKKLDVVQAEKNHLEHRFADAEQSRASKQKLAAMESSLQALEGSNKSMQDTIKSLESEVREEKTKLNDYKRKIRNLSMGP